MSEFITSADEFEKLMRSRQEPGVICSGISLRDYFAGQALPSLMAAMIGGDIGPHPVAGGGPEGFAASAYDVASAMLAERERAK